MSRTAYAREDESLVPMEVVLSVEKRRAGCGREQMADNSIARNLLRGVRHSLDNFCTEASPIQ